MPFLLDVDIYETQTCLRFLLFLQLPRVHIGFSMRAVCKKIFLNVVPPTVLDIPLLNLREHLSLAALLQIFIYSLDSMMLLSREMTESQLCSDVLIKLQALDRHCSPESHVQGHQKYSHSYSNSSLGPGTYVTPTPVVQFFLFCFSLLFPSPSCNEFSPVP